jgi:hypothetical protein
MNTPNTEPLTLPGQPLTHSILQSQNRAFRGTGGRRQENRGHRFHPAFLDTETGVTYLSRFANGTPAPIHVLEGLPDTSAPPGCPRPGGRGPIDCHRRFPVRRPFPHPQGGRTRIGLEKGVASISFRPLRCYSGHHTGIVGRLLTPEA